ncbi:glycosyltransferase [Natronorubrum thiooxidans]|uniref:Glycosyl transferase 4-like domain-containing protein n=1 Tax=Natronorubrum thiooxidans TaxID=308853 RepID=A0A1N7DGV9_9EURY|nr:glycosyltransferase [Natronorubrum thiooxidans]SIR75066.1 Glycosyl transferase 4-like domain-containing protein [Natronorubrum thiooxidans]
MKVLQVVTSPRPFFDQQVAALETRGIDCTVCSVPGAHRGDSTRSLTDYARFYPELLSELRSEEYDLVHANYGLVAPFALAQPTRPVVLTLWGTDLMSDQSWLRSLSQYSARHASATVVPSHTMSRALEADHELIPFGVDTDLFRPIPQQEARDRIGWNTDRPIALFPYDRSRDVKDYDRARRLVEHADADLELRAVTGVDHDKIPYYMNASDVLLVTSKRESGPMVVKEAAACTLPIVSTDVGFVSETIGDVRNCVVSDDDRELIDGLETVVDADSRSNGRDVIDGLGIETLGENLHGLYRRVLGRDDPTERRTEVGHGI